MSCVEVRVGGEVVALNTSGLKFKMTTTVYDDDAPKPRAGPYPLLDNIQRKRMICQNLSLHVRVRLPGNFRQRPRRVRRLRL